MSKDNLVTLDEIKDLVKADNLKASDLFSVQQMKDAVRDAEAVDKARAEEHEKILAEGDKTIADGKRFKAAMDAIGTGADADKGKAEDKDADPNAKYLDPEKNPFIKLGGAVDKGGDAELPDVLNPKKNPFIKIGE